MQCTAVNRCQSFLRYYFLSSLVFGVAGTGGGALADERRDSRKIARKKSNPTLSSAPSSAEAPTPLNEVSSNHNSPVLLLHLNILVVVSSNGHPLVTPPIAKKMRIGFRRVQKSPSVRTIITIGTQLIRPAIPHRKLLTHPRHLNKFYPVASTGLTGNETWVSPAKDMQVCYRTSLPTAVVFYDVELTAPNIRVVSTRNVTVVKFLFSMPVRIIEGAFYLSQIPCQRPFREPAGCINQTDKRNEMCWCQPMPDLSYDITSAKINSRISEDFDGFALKKPAHMEKHK
ncbi:hypothetical protein CLF_102131 [Clonorchis sinensis]|uniref:Uncharacterized protein n=1 Tax=Clonorchis sinensis TaxID=79923 RepID=G7Y7C9_CLOSI|nr:hypothetical protein CLF_102131 [Clonorchis sinensis]